MRQRIRLTEGDLHRIVKESVNRILNEELCYSTNPSIDTTSKDIGMIVKDGMKEVSKLIEKDYKDTLRPYNDSDDEYFRNNPNAAEGWKEQLEKQHYDGIEKIIRNWVYDRYFDAGRTPENEKIYNKVYRILCHKLLGYVPGDLFW